MSAAPAPPDRTVPPEPVLLPVLDADRQRAAERLAALLESAGDDAVSFRASIEWGPHPGCWLLSADGPGLRIDALDGRAAALHPDRVDAAVTALERLEPLLDLLEARTGWVFEPVSTDPTAPADAVAIALAASRNGVPVARFAVAVPSEAAALAQTPIHPPVARLAGVPLPCRLLAVAAHLTVEDAAALAPGDLLVLHPRPWTAVLAADPAGGFTGLLDPDTGAFTTRQQGQTFVTSGEPGGAETVREFRVPLELRLAGASATLGELASLREGGTLALGPLTAGLAVELSVAGRPVASGEIVRLGDRFAVVVERLAAEDEPAARASVTAPDGDA